MAKRERARKETGLAEAETIAAREAQRTLGVLLSRVAFGRERIRITRHGKEVAALVSAQDLERLEGAA